MEDLSNFLEAGSKTGSLSGGGFERDTDFQLWMLGMKTVEIADDTADAGFHAGTKMGAGMEDKGGYPELLTA